MQITPTWLVRNAGNYNYGSISLREATAWSSNTVYARVADGWYRQVLTPAMPWVFEPTSPYLSTTPDLKASLQSNNALPLQRLQPVAYDDPLPLQDRRP